MQLPEKYKENFDVLSEGPSSGVSSRRTAFARNVEILNESLFILLALPTLAKTVQDYISNFGSILHHSARVRKQKTLKSYVLSYALKITTNFPPRRPCLQKRRLLNYGSLMQFVAAEMRFNFRNARKARKLNYIFHLYFIAFKSTRLLQTQWRRQGRRGCPLTPWPAPQCSLECSLRFVEKLVRKVVRVRELYVMAVHHIT